MSAEKLPRIAPGAEKKSAVSTETLTDVFPDFAVDPAEMSRRTAMLKDYVREHMNEGEDYGVVPGGMKPTLFKPGAEKLIAVFGLSPIVEVASRVEDWDAGFLSYEIKVQLINKRTQIIEAEGVGSCNSRERRYKNQDAANIANTLLKMAKKRALIDATLSATRASGMFTQDLEDLDLSVPAESTNRSMRDDASRPARPASASATSSASETLTNAQHRAILAISGRVFGRHSREEDLDRMVNKPLEQLTKSEASALIDQLRGMLGESAGSQQGGESEMSFTRASRNGDGR